MKLISVDELIENQIIARPVLVNDFTVLLSEGTVIKKPYIQKLKELNVSFVYVEDHPQDGNIEYTVIKTETARELKGKVQSILERHLYQNNQELKELGGAADQIISDILSDENVIEKVYDIRERSTNLYEHCMNVCALVTILGLKVGIDKVIAHDLGISALLHDLGLRYIAIPYENRDIFLMDTESIAEYKIHPILAYTALKNESWISETSKTIILQHHEHIDGSGYPLHASKLGRETQILTICDAFDEMICGIGCARSKVYEAVEYLRSTKGVYFYADLVDLFLSFVAVYPAGSNVLLNDGRKGMVLKQNPEFPERPIVKILSNEAEEEIVDLLHASHLVITEVIHFQ